MQNGSLFLESAHIAALKVRAVVCAYSFLVCCSLLAAPLAGLVVWLISPWHMVMRSCPTLFLATILVGIYLFLMMVFFYGLVEMTSRRIGEEPKGEVDWGEAEKIVKPYFYVAASLAALSASSATLAEVWLFLLAQ